MGSERIDFDLEFVGAEVEINSTLSHSLKCEDTHLGRIHCNEGIELARLLSHYMFGDHHCSQENYAYGFS